MAFDAFMQYIEPGSDAPPVEGEDQAPQMQSPTAVQLQDEVKPEATEKVSDTTASVKQKQS